MNRVNPLPSQRHSWHSHPLEETLQLLDSDAEIGLNSQQIEQRREQYGSNELEDKGGRSSLKILIDQFTNIMLLMLIAVAIISGIMDVVELQSGGGKDGIPFKDTIAILIIVILNGVLGYIQESKAEKALAALKSLSAPKVQAIRDGKRVEVESPTIVPGDIILIEAGSQLCADGQIIEAFNLQVRESSLTGEAQAVMKVASNTGLSEDTSLGDRTNMVFTGTEVVYGRAKVIVTNTGMSTELGKIAQMLQDVENEPTPLQQRLTQLGNVLVSSSLILVAVVVLFGTIKEGLGALRGLVEVSLSMAVAVVPEGLPAVITVTLALGTQRMVKRNALIRQLPAVETLGSVDTICSDKTGTLTQNKMVVQQIKTLGGDFQVTGDGYTPIGEFFNEKGETIDVAKYKELEALLIACLVCNDAVLTQENQQWTILGDPTEGALLSLAGKAGLEQQSIKQLFPRVEEFTFSSERKRMSVICEHDAVFPITNNQSHLMFTKGSPELILERCQYYQLGEQTLLLTESERQFILDQNNLMASKGLRVLGFSYKNLDSVPHSSAEEATEQELVWMGLVAMLDAPRPEVKIAVAKCKSAGIRTVMITGDHQLTARAIAEQLGISQEGELLLTGQELERLSQKELEEKVETISIYARVAPEHKLRIVQALQKRGRFVAMTGDGVNDAPALKQSDIGIAMGITGTDVSKEASDMVLLDDNFATIVAATEEGRVVYSNIRRFIKYILGSNIGEVITIAAAPILGLSGIPLSPLQILWMNLVTDGLPALALALEPPSPDVMSKPPFSPRENIFARGLGSYIVRIGIIFAILTIVLMEWSYFHTQNSNDPERWKTMVFTTLCIAQMGHALAVRSDTRLTIQMNPLSNPFLLVAVVVTTGLQLMLIYVEPLRNFFGTHLLTGEDLLICLGFSALMFVWIEMEKLFIPWFKSISRS